MIPEFNEHGVLPEGIHRTSTAEFSERFAVFHRSDRRLQIHRQLEKLMMDARQSGIVLRILIAGSYVTANAEPNDFDCILVLDPAIVEESLPPYRYNLVSRHMARRLYGGDIVPVLEGSQALGKYLDFFQKTRRPTHGHH